MRLFLALLTTLSFYACAPTNAAAIRKDKSLTLGLPGASYRPTGRIGVGMTGASGKSTAKVDNTKTGSDSLVKSSDDALESERHVESASHSVTPFMQVFPWDTSAFFVGAGASFQHASYHFGEETVDSTLASPQYGEVNYETQSTYVSVPMGWAWIWGSGFSLTIDFGPQVRVARTAKVTRDGTSDNVSASQRDKTIQTIDSLEPKYSLGGGSTIIGWSF